MPKRKSKFHQIIVHHNRWLIWAVAYTLMVTIALVGYIKVSDIQMESDLTAENTFTPAHSYTNQFLGFSLRYPSNWAIEADNNSVTFAPTSSADLGVSVTVTAVADEKALRKSLTISTEKTISVDNVTGIEITNNLSEGHLEAVVLVRHNNKLYVIRGTENFVDQLLLTFNFLN